MDSKKIKICKNCKKEYYGQGKFFCSIKCANKNKNLGHICSEETKKKISRAGKGKHFHICSEETCKKITLSRLGSKNPMFGIKGKNNPLFGRKRKKETIEKCSKTFFKKGRTPWNKGKKTGIKPPNWKGGTTTEEKKFKDSYLFKEWRFNVFKRDNYICQKCKEPTGGKLEAHHIENFITRIDLRIELSNGITLCKNCHNYFHKKYGFSNNNKEQLKKFLNI